MILFFSIKDWANVGCMFAKSLNMIGEEAYSVTVYPTGIKYTESSIIMGEFSNVRSLFDRADIIVLMHSNPGLLGVPYDLNKKKLAIFHGGSEYRERPEVINDFFNDKVYVSLVQTGNLLGLGAKNEKWIIPPVDTDRITPVERHNKKLIVGHFPRSFLVKGTEHINKIVTKLQSQYDFEYLYSNMMVDWQESLRRMSRCDIYICAMKPQLFGKHYGGGVEITDLESMALGNITITHHTTIDRFEKEFGKCPLVVANTPEELENQLHLVLKMTDEERKELRMKTRKWVEGHASYEAVGKRLKEILYEN